MRVRLRVSVLGMSIAHVWSTRGLAGVAPVVSFRRRSRTLNRVVVALWCWRPSLSTPRVWTLVILRSRVAALRLVAELAPIARVVPAALGVRVVVVVGVGIAVALLIIGVVVVCIVGAAIVRCAVALTVALVVGLGLVVVVIVSLLRLVVIVLVWCGGCLLLRLAVVCAPRRLVVRVRIVCHDAD